ncbi:PREDICTED: limbic system-associated membrane protein-like isoform X3 [Acropora digitifera]|uniref:limbic system-associated membrane protein-like isoform X3 n=1 Tax=Acropora digitifera TaxID=70779 RepID=UPI00077ADFEC|nr:PREDICTED: limbic system-associated membrane protein-like isoform X3 [Acropora digitifera]
MNRKVDDMFSAPNFVAFLFAVVLFSPESDTANITAVITKSPSPLYAVEGQNLTLEWTYTVVGSVGSAKFAVVNEDGSEFVFWKSFSPGIGNMKPQYQERFKAKATDTRAELRILSVQRSDEETYKLNILATGGGSILEEVILVVNFPPNITEISGYQTVTEGKNVTLKCLADGKPTPNITWTRRSVNRTVNMPLSGITRQDAGKYRCTADNGIGSPAVGDVRIVVQYPVEAKGFGENDTVIQGGKKTFSCPVDGIPKPNITWYRGREVSGTPIFIGEKLEARDTGCYTCAASNSLGTSINITQCLTVVESSTASTTPTSAQGLSRTVIGVVVGVAVFVVIITGLVTWWVCKEKKCRKNSKSENRQYVEVDQRNN